MVKRVKRIGKGVESLKKEIERHFRKIEEDIEEGNIDRGRYHIKEIDKSLIKSLEAKIELLGIKDNSVKDYRQKLDKIKNDLDKISHL